MIAASHGTPGGWTPGDTVAVVGLVTTLLGVALGAGLSSFLAGRSRLKRLLSEAVFQTELALDALSPGEIEVEEDSSAADAKAQQRQLVRLEESKAVTVALARLAA